MEKGSSSSNRQKDVATHLGLRYWVSVAKSVGGLDEKIPIALFYYHWTNIIITVSSISSIVYWKHCPTAQKTRGIEGSESHLTHHVRKQWFDAEWRTLRNHVQRLLHMQQLRSPTLLFLLQQLQHLFSTGIVDTLHGATTPVVPSGLWIWGMGEGSFTSHIQYLEFRFQVLDMRKSGTSDD